jgi:hypothetical protein
MLGASFTYIDFLKTPSGLQRESPRSTWAGFGAEAYFNRPVASHIGLRGGATLDTGTETTVFHPVLLGVITF